MGLRQRWPKHGSNCCWTSWCWKWNVQNLSAAEYSSRLRTQIQVQSCSQTDASGDKSAARRWVFKFNSSWRKILDTCIIFQVNMCSNAVKAVNPDFNFNSKMYLSTIADISLSLCLMILHNSAHETVCCKIEQWRLDQHCVSLWVRHLLSIKDDLVFYRLWALRVNWLGN